jgi:hypothetical protein
MGEFQQMNWLLELIPDKFLKGSTCKVNIEVLTVSVVKVSIMLGSGRAISVSLSYSVTDLPAFSGWRLSLSGGNKGHILLESYSNVFMSSLFKLTSAL